MRHDLHVLARMVDMFINTLVYRMCPLRRHDLRVLDRMVDIFINTFNVSSKSMCPRSYGRNV